MIARDVVFPSGHQALYEKNRYSPAIRANGLLFVSGQVGSREDGSPEPTLEGQVRRAFDNLNAILADRRLQLQRRDRRDCLCRQPGADLREGVAHRGRGSTGGRHRIPR